MKVLEGTPEEIKAYLGQTREESFPSAARKVALNYMQKSYAERKADKEEQVKSDIKGISHWSSTKRMWVTIGDMDEHYIINVLRQKLTNRDADELLDDGEFCALVVTLSDKILENKFSG